MEIASALLSLLVMAALWIGPVVLGVREAERKGVSKHWMWFGIYPILGGWITWAILRFVVKTRERCPGCNAIVPVSANFCPACRIDLKCKTSAGSRRELPASGIKSSTSQESTRSALEGWLDGSDADGSGAVRTAVFRWSKDQVQCFSCNQFTNIRGEACMVCGVPAPKMVCPNCRGHYTKVTGGKQQAILLGVACLFVAGSFKSCSDYLAKSGGFELQVGIMTITGILGMILGIVGIVTGFTRHSRRLHCMKCSQSVKIADAAAVFVPAIRPVKSPEGGQWPTT